MIDIVIPNNNEEEFITIAEKLGYGGICFLYDIEDYLNNKKKLQIGHKLKISFGILANSRNINKIKVKLKGQKVFIAIKSSNMDRQVIEGSKADIIFSFEENTRKDFIHQRASGLNHVLCKLAKENDITIGFSLYSILDAKDKHVMLGRITQNMKLCKKFKSKTAIASFAERPLDMRDSNDLVSLLKTQGLTGLTFLTNTL
tara:strand:+ start:3428 stop:4030 length:603 start_codon:yes stop_codon:yes gene_type:complete